MHVLVIAIYFFYLLPPFSMTIIGLLTIQCNLGYVSNIPNRLCSSSILLKGNIAGSIDDSLCFAKNYRYSFMILQ